MLFDVVLMFRTQFFFLKKCHNYNYQQCLRYLQRSSISLCSTPLSCYCALLAPVYAAAVAVTAAAAAVAVAAVVVAGALAAAGAVDLVLAWECAHLDCLFVYAFKRLLKWRLRFERVMVVKSGK